MLKVSSIQKEVISRQGRNYKLDNNKLSKKKKETITYPWIKVVRIYKIIKQNEGNHQYRKNTTTKRKGIEKKRTNKELDNFRIVDEWHTMVAKVNARDKTLHPDGFSLYCCGCHSVDLAIYILDPTS